LHPILLTIAIGSATSLIAYLLFLLKEFLEKRMLTSITINNSDPCYKWLLTFLIKNDYLNHSMSDCVVKIVKEKRKWYEHKKTKERPKVEYYPAPGSHSFQYRGRKMWAFQQEGKTNCVGWDSKPLTEESIVVICYGQDVSLIQSLIDEAVTYSMEQDRGLLQIYEVPGWWDIWIKSMSKKARPLDSVLLDTNIMETLVEDIKNFQESGEWYVEKGVPYRRGYMLYGPPGTGKTSFTQAVAGALKLNLCYLNISNNEINDDSLNRLLSDAPARSIILLEDIDALFNQRDGDKKKGLSFSGFLNALDGVRSQEG